MAPVVTMKQLLEAGVHFGHQTRRWNPKMKRFIYGERNGIYIIDLQQTLQRIEVAYSFVRDLVAGGGTVLFIGTKKQAQDPIRRAAQACGMPYLNERWLGGMLTNFTTISGRVRKMQEYQRMRAAGDFEAMPKKEALIISRELEKLERNLGGIRDMARLPDAVFIIDTKKEHIAVTEANKLGVPVVAVVDTNCDPDVIDYVIPGNDDAIRSGTLMCRIIADAVTEGRFIASRRGGPAQGPAPTPAQAPPPSPEQEAARAAQQAEARRQAALQAAEREARVVASQRAELVGAQQGTGPENPVRAEAAAAMDVGEEPVPAPSSTPEPGAIGPGPDAVASAPTPQES
jgi:small subunit ribosomal protein S2